MPYKVRKTRGQNEYKIFNTHSLGAKLASQVCANSKEIINLNKAVINPADSLTKVKSNAYNIRSSKDIVSTLLPVQNKSLTIDSPYFSNILKEHKTDVFDRLDPNLLVGKGVKSFNLIHILTK